MTFAWFVRRERQFGAALLVGSTVFAASTTSCLAAEHAGTRDPAERHNASSVIGPSDRPHAPDDLTVAPTALPGPSIRPAPPEPSFPTVTAPIAAACERLAARLPSYPRAACRRTGLTESGARSVRREPIMVREQRAVPEPVEGATRVLFIGGIHGDELTAAELSLRWLDKLTQDDARRFHWRFIPVLNPDGILAKRPTRVNANGVDLNRNFPATNWSGGALRYWERMTLRDPRRYPGRAPISEPESKLLAEEIERFSPDVIISVHAPLGLLDYDGPTGAAPSRFGKLYLEPVGVYPGSLGSYSGIMLGIPVVTLELPHALKMPTADEQKKIWNDMLTWLNKQPSRLAQGPVRTP